MRVIEQYEPLSPAKQAEAGMILASMFLSAVNEYKEANVMDVEVAVNIGDEDERMGKQELENT